MPLNWLDVSPLSFNVLMLLDKFQISLLPGWPPENEMAIALKNNPAVEWYLRHKCPEINDWLDKILSTNDDDGVITADEIRRAEIKIMQTINDLLVYTVDPAAYDNLPFHNWDSNELTMLTDYKGKSVIDVGSGTGRLALVVAPLADYVFAVEPVTALREFIKNKAKANNIQNVYPVDGLITELPFPDNFVDIVISGHVFGDELEREYNELARVAKPNGMIIFCPGNIDQDNEIHEFLINNHFDWSKFEEPVEGIKRKYWKKLNG